MKTLLTRALVLGGGLAAAGVLTATAAFAHGAPFTVTAGSAPAGTTVAVTATSGTVTFKDTTTNQTLSCTGSTLKGTIVAGTATSGTQIATINGAGAVFTNCTGPAGLKFTVTGSGTWYLNVSDSTSGVNTGTVSNIQAHVVSNAGPTCSFDVGSNTGSFSGTVAPGTIAGSYTNSTKALAAPATNPGSLGLWNLTGSGTNQYCVSPSILKRGDKASFSTTYTLTADNSAYNPVAVN